MTPLFRLLGALAISMPLLAGCGSGETVVWPEPGKSGSFEVSLTGEKTALDNQAKKSQRYQITATASDPVNIFVYLFKEEAAVAKALQENQIIAGVLKHQKETKDINLEVQVPAETKAVLYFTRAVAGKSPTVKMKITLKK